MVKIKFKSNFTEAQILSMPQLLKKLKKNVSALNAKLKPKQSKQAGGGEVHLTAQRISARLQTGSLG